LATTAASDSGSSRCGSLVFHIQLSRLEINFGPHHRDLTNLFSSGLVSGDDDGFSLQRPASHSVTSANGTGDHGATTTTTTTTKEEEDGDHDIEKGGAAGPHPPSLHPCSSSSVVDESITQLAVLFPLPSETCLDTSLVVKRIKSALNPSEKSTPQSPTKMQNQNYQEPYPIIMRGSESSYVDWEVAKSVGVKMVGKVVMPSPATTLHALIKVMDSKGQSLAQGVIAVPR